MINAIKGTLSASTLISTELNKSSDKKIANSGK